MKMLKVISSIIMLSATLLLCFGTAQAKGVGEQKKINNESYNDLVSLGNVDDSIEVKMESSLVESLEEGERQKLLSYAIESFYGQQTSGLNIQNEVSTCATTSGKTIHTYHTCYPIGPYLADRHYRVAYYYNTTTGVLISKIDFYICGHVGKSCNYLASVTTYY